MPLARTFDGARTGIVFRPLDAKIKRTLLAGLIGLLSQGPVGLADGREVEADWESLAEDAGVPLTVADARARARRLVQEARERLAGLGDEQEDPKEARLNEDQARRPAGAPNGGQYAPEGGGGEESGKDESGGEASDRQKRSLPSGGAVAYEAAKPVSVKKGDWQGLSTRDLRKAVAHHLGSLVAAGGGTLRIEHDLGTLVLAKGRIGKLLSGGYFDRRTADVIMNLESVVASSVHAATEAPKPNDPNTESVHRLVAKVRHAGEEFPVQVTVKQDRVPNPDLGSDKRVYDIEDLKLWE